MRTPTTYYLLTLLMFCCSVTSMNAQYYNKDVEAKLNIENKDDFLSITGMATNKTEVNQSLRYELSVFKNSGGNTSKNSQSGRFTLVANESKDLSQTTINLGDQAKVIVLLLIYDLDENLMGKARYVIEDGEPKENNDIPVYQTEKTQEEKPDGIVLRGIVTEETKTKAGGDFFDFFYNAYRSKGINSEKIVVVEEQMGMGRSTKILVKVAGSPVFQFFSQTKSDYLERMANIAIMRVQRHLAQLERDAETLKKF